MAETRGILEEILILGNLKCGVMNVKLCKCLARYDGSKIPGTKGIKGWINVPILACRLDSHFTVFMQPYKINDVSLWWIDKKGANV